MLALERLWKAARREVWTPVHFPVSLLPSLLLLCGLFFVLILISFLLLPAPVPTNRRSIG